MSRRCITQVDLTAVIRKVCQDDAQVHKTGEDACTQPPDIGRGNFRNVARTNNRCLSNAKSDDKPTSIYGAKIAFGSHEDDNAQHPQQTELPCSPDASDPVTDEEGAEAQVSMTNA